MDELTDKLLLRFPRLRFTNDWWGDGMTIYYDAYAKPGQVKQIEAFIAKQNINFEYRLERMAF